MTTCPYCASSLPAMSATCPTCGAALSSPALEIGAIIGDKYRVETVLGQGGFGITYLALDTTLDHRVAIKELFVDGSTRGSGNVIPPSGMDFAQTKHKFLEEAQTVQRFDNAGIVRVYGVFEGNQTAYMVMEALSGATLTADVLENGAFPAKTVLELARQLCASLEIVHAADLLHRDIKPDNVFLSSDGRVVLIDFGSARGFAQGQVKRLTRLVTPGYAAPEQYASQAAFGTYTDVYGLAATLYYAVEGQMPPMATDLMLGARLEFKQAGQLQAGLEAGLRVKVDERPQTVRELLDLLEQPAPRVVPATSSVVSGAAPPAIYVQGWRFELGLLHRASREFYFNDIQLITVKQAPPQANPDNGMNIFLMILGAIAIFFGTTARSPWLIFPGIVIMGIGGAQDKIAALIPIPTRYAVWVETQNGEELLSDFATQNQAVQLGQAIHDRSGARLEIIN